MKSFRRDVLTGTVVVGLAAVVVWRCLPARADVTADVAAEVDDRLAERQVVPPVAGVEAAPVPHLEVEPIVGD